MKLKTLFIVGLSLVLPAEARLSAQGAASGAPAPVFEVASIKPCTWQPPIFRILPGGRVTITCTRLRGVIALAYDYPDSRIVGGPEWLSTDYFDLDTKAEGTPTEKEVHLMLQAMLEERSQLKVHIETRQMPVYRLVPARSDARFGPQLTANTRTCPTTENTGVNPPQPAAVPGQISPCAVSGGRGPGRLTGGRVTMADLAERLATILGRPVEDHTTLSGRFDFSLAWTPDQGATATQDGASIFTAVQEQLGLKLESATGPVEVLVIDSASPPTLN